MNLEIQKLFNWLEAQARENPFCEAGVKVVFHDGLVKRTEKLLIEKEKPTGNTGGGSRGKYQK
jgi:hypothetical protein